MCACMCVCVCLCEKESKRQNERKEERNKKKDEKTERDKKKERKIIVALFSDGNLMVSGHFRHPNQKNCCIWQMLSITLTLPFPLSVVHSPESLNCSRICGPFSSSLFQNSKHPSFTANTNTLCKKPLRAVMAF